MKILLHSQLHQVLYPVQIKKPIQGIHPGLDSSLLLGIMHTYSHLYLIVCFCEAETKAPRENPTGMEIQAVT